jgi:hypothetical protein
VPAVKASSGEGILLEEVLTLKGVVQRVGPRHLRTLIDVLSR